MMIQINPDIPVIALTATATPKVQSDIVKNLDLRDPSIFISSFNRPNLYYEVLPKIKKSQTDENIVRFIKSMKKKSGIIYTLNRKTTEELADILMANGIKAVAYHAGLDSKLRSERHVSVAVKLPLALDQLPRGRQHVDLSFEPITVEPPAFSELVGKLLEELFE